MMRTMAIAVLVGRAVEAFSGIAEEERGCAVSVVGGGWAGVYAAYRLVVDSKTVAAADLCLFEGGTRTGGRTYSVEVEGLVIDVGAYRFSREMHLPGDLILGDLGLETKCYQPSCAPDAEFNHTLYKIVDSEGNAAGYESPIRSMTAQLEEHGVRLFYSHELVKLEAGTKLTFSNGATFSSKKVFLNLPRPIITRLDAAPLFAVPDAARLLRCEPCPLPAEAPPVLQLKVYIIYEDPWWITKLNISEGLLNDAETNPPFVGRYHDGPLLLVNGTYGPGALEVVYTFSMTEPEITWYQKFADYYSAFATSEDPLTISRDPALLGPVHEKLMRLHSPAFEKAGILTSAVAPPMTAVMGFWDIDPNNLLPTPISSNFKAQFDTCPVETCLGDVTPHDYARLTSDPTQGKHDIFIANNDYYYTSYQDTLCCWAEQSLKVAERILHDHFNAPKPTWLDQHYYETTVLAL